jgi:hypothetical protein
VRQGYGADGQKLTMTVENKAQQIKQFTGLIRAFQPKHGIIIDNQ